MKINTILIPLLAVGSASAFSPSLPTNRAFASRALFSEEEASEPVAAKKESSPAGALVPIKEETIEFTAGLIGGAVGLAVGGPVLGAISAAAANFASKSDNEISEVVQGVSKASIEVYNYLATLDAKYEILTKAQSSLEDALEKLKAQDNVDPETVKKVEDALANTTAKIKEINDEYDLVGAGQTALGVIGDLVEKAVKKAGELNEEYKLTDKAQDALKGAVEKAKSASE